MYKKIIKHIIDFILALIGLIFLFPIAFVVYVLSWIIHKENPFFYQPRPGLNEKVFKIIKFKTMNSKRDIKGNLLPDEERLTKWGDFLRKTSLDEIPQLLNVIKGDMNLVGPRPLRVRYLPYYTEIEKLRHTVKPGITGLAQVSGRNSLSWDEKLAIDVEYVQLMSFFTDFKIILKTFTKLFKKSDIDIDTTVNNALDVYRDLEKTQKT